MFFEGTVFHIVADRGLYRMDVPWKATAWIRLKVVRIMTSKSQKISEGRIDDTMIDYMHACGC